MATGFLVVASSVFGECPGVERFQLKVDDSQAAEVLDLLRAGKSDDPRIRAVSETVETQAAVHHTAKFDPLATAERWRNDLSGIIRGQKLSDDPFRFNALYERRNEAAQTISAIDANPTWLQRGIETSLNPYVPQDMTVAAEMTLVAGARAIGWADDGGADAFYFNVRAGAGDLTGIRTIATHELYHVVLAHLLPKPQLLVSTALGRVERVVLEGIDEGLASHVARFDPSASGQLSGNGAHEDKENQARRPENWKLMESLLISTYHSADIAPDDVGRIAFAGAYDQPGYYVFRDMAEAIEAAKGRGFLLDLLRQPPAKFVLAYHAAVAPGLTAMRLSPSALAIIHRLDSAEPRQRQQHFNGAPSKGGQACEPSS